MLWTSIYVLPGLPSCFSSLGFRVAWPSCAQRWIFLLKPCWARRLDFFRAEIFSFECSVQKFSYFGVLCKNIGQVSLHVREGVKKQRFFGRSLPNLFTHPTAPCVFLRFGRTIGEIRVEKGDFQGDLVFFERFGPCLGISHHHYNGRTPAVEVHRTGEWGCSTSQPPPKWDGKSQTLKLHAPPPTWAVAPPARWLGGGARLFPGR